MKILRCANKALETDSLSAWRKAGRLSATSGLRPKWSLAAERRRDNQLGVAIKNGLKYAIKCKKQETNSDKQVRVTTSNQDLTLDHVRPSVHSYLEDQSLAIKTREY